jgi:hypothetical protein
MPRSLRRWMRPEPRSRGTPWTLPQHRPSLFDCECRTLVHPLLYRQSRQVPGRSLVDVSSRRHCCARCMHETRPQPMRWVSTYLVHTATARRFGTFRTCGGSVLNGFKCVHSSPLPLPPTPPFVHPSRSLCNAPSFCTNHRADGYHTRDEEARGAYQ